MNGLFDAVVLGLLALLPLINPPTTVALFLALSRGLSRAEKNRQAFLTVCYVFMIMTITYYTGEVVMRVFNISIPGLRIAGGGILIFIGSKMLFPAPRPLSAMGAEAGERTRFAFIPLAMPSTAGPGTIAMIISASATIKNNTVFATWVLWVAPPLIFLSVSLILWICLLTSGLIMKALGESGIDVISRLMGFYLFVWGVQFVINGCVEIVRTLMPGA